MTGPDESDRLAPELAAEHARYEFDDAAYLLGALEPGQQAAFEQHLARCPLCQERTARFGDLPAVLARADVSAWEPELPPDTLLPRLLREAAASRRRRTWRLGVLAAAAACLVAVLATAGVLGWQHAHQPQTLTMQPVGPDPEGVYATIQLIGSGSDTRVKLACGYHSDGGYPHGWTPSYRMVIYNRRGETVNLGSWTPQPGEDVQITRASPWPRQNISKIEVADDQGNTVLRLRL
ncbi:anti-sigma factor family protein [Jatrophihabitans sp.]|uniref:anti-sigma factor family protein n=1 Tax=Jatrophihabitans sp. TaxID=1932789 RepID=UPI002BAEE04B|nr:zf-HC2 domain-containing protein [Jatrophihabitans sp.]